MSVMEKIRRKAKKLPEGQPVTVQAFLSAGNRASIDQALSRLVKAGELSRPARGVYVRPKQSPYVGAVPPDPMEVAKALAAQSGYIVQIQGAEAVRRMGLSAQVPSKLIFYTNGPGRQFRLGKLEVTLKHVTPRKVILAGRQAGIALTALWYLGKEQVTTRTIAHIQSKLPPKEFKVLCSQTPSMPGWMHDVIIEYTEGVQCA